MERVVGRMAAEGSKWFEAMSGVVLSMDQLITSQWRLRELHTYQGIKAYCVEALV